MSRAGATPARRALVARQQLVAGATQDGTGKRIVSTARNAPLENTEPKTTLPIIVFHVRPTPVPRVHHVLH